MDNLSTMLAALNGQVAEKLQLQEQVKKDAETRATETKQWEQEKTGLKNQITQLQDRIKELEEAVAAAQAKLLETPKQVLNDEEQQLRKEEVEKLKAQLAEKEETIVELMDEAAEKEANAVMEMSKELEEHKEIIKSLKKLLATANPQERHGTILTGDEVERLRVDITNQEYRLNKMGDDSVRDLQQLEYYKKQERERAATFSSEDAVRAGAENFVLVKAQFQKLLKKVPDLMERNPRKKPRTVASRGKTQYRPELQDTAEWEVPTKCIRCSNTKLQPEMDVRFKCQKHHSCRLHSGGHTLLSLQIQASLHTGEVPQVAELMATGEWAPDFLMTKLRELTSCPVCSTPNGLTTTVRDHVRALQQEYEQLYPSAREKCALPPEATGLEDRLLADSVMADSIASLD